MRGKPIAYSETEMRWLEENRMLVISDYHRAFCVAFGREDVTAGHLHALRKRKGWKTGRTGLFEKGSVPANKGKPCPPGTGGRHPNARATQFRKGHGRTGVAAKVYKPIGTERITRDGYRERKIHDGMPLQSRWRAVHLIEWERENGPIPDGYALKCLDGDKANTAPSNWEAIPRSMLPRLAGGSHKQYVPYDSAPDELKPAILAVARIEQAGRARRKGKREVDSQRRAR